VSFTIKKTAKRPFQCQSGTKFPGIAAINQLHNTVGIRFYRLLEHMLLTYERVSAIALPLFVALLTGIWKLFIP